MNTNHGSQTKPDSFEGIKKLKMTIGRAAKAGKAVRTFGGLFGIAVGPEIVHQSQPREDHGHIQQIGRAPASQFSTSMA